MSNYINYEEYSSNNNNDLEFRLKEYLRRRHYSKMRGEKDLSHLKEEYKIKKEDIKIMNDYIKKNSVNKKLNIYNATSNGMPIYPKILSGCGAEPRGDSYGGSRDYDHRNDYILNTNEMESAASDECNENNTYFKYNYNDRYGKMPKEHFTEKSRMDSETKKIIPKVTNSSKKDINTNIYTHKPYMGFGSGNGSVDIESNMRGMPTRSNKVYGYPDVSSHHFDFISRDLQNAYGSVMEYPISTRLENTKSIAGRYKREIL
tara:strand:- start:7 stop:786 length:780 start_codon:yes stop_codon:yes gene_type:complete